MDGIVKHFKRHMGKIPFHLEDYLKLHFNVYNFSYGGVSNVDIIYQFSNLPQYRPGDRIAVIWTSPLRFTIKDKNGQNFTFGDFNIPSFDKPDSPHYIPPILQDSITGKLKVVLGGESVFVHQEQKNFFYNEIRFIEYFKNLHSKYSPVFMTWDPLLSDISETISISLGSSIFPNPNFTIKDEHGYNDAHLGGEGNWYLYKYLHSELGVKDDLLPLKFNPIGKII